MKYIRGRLNWIIAAGVAVVLVCAPLSMLPAVYFAERTPDAKVIFYYPRGNPVWVAPWLYYFSQAFRYLAFGGLALMIVGLALRCGRRKT